MQNFIEVLHKNQIEICTFMLIMNRKSTLLFSVLLAASVWCRADEESSYSYTELTPAQGYPTSVNCIMVQKKGAVWIGGDDGLYVMTGKSSISHYTSESFKNDLQLPGNRIIGIHEDSDGGVWLLTEDGVKYYKKPFSKTEERSAVSFEKEIPVAYSILESIGKVYLGGINKLWEYDKKTGSLNVTCEFETERPFTINNIFSSTGGVLLLFNNSGKRMKVFRNGSGRVEDARAAWSNKMSTAMMDSKGNLWVAYLGQGIKCFDMFGNEICSVTPQEGLSSDMVTCFTEQNGKIWIGTDGGGIDILDPVTMEITVLSGTSRFSKGIPSETISCLSTDAEGNIWAGRKYGGIFVVHQPPVQFIRSDHFIALCKDGINSIVQTKNDGLIWIGTRNRGLLSYDKRTDKFKRYPSTYTFNIFSISEMDENYMVLSCPQRGFKVFNRHTGELTPAKYISDSVNYYANKGLGAVLANDKEGRVMAFSDKIYRYDVRHGELNTFKFPACVKDWENLDEVSGTRCEYFWDKDCIYRWDEESTDKLIPVWASDIGPISCATVGNNSCIWFSAGNKVLLFDTSDSTVHVEDISITGNIQSLLCDKLGRVWIGTSTNLFMYMSETSRCVMLGSIDGVRSNEYTLHAKLLAEDGDLYFGGLEGLTHVSADIRFPIEEDPEILVKDVIVDEKYQRNIHNLVIDPDHMFITVNCFACSSDNLHERRYRVNVTGMSALAFETTDPSLRFRTLSPSKYKIMVSTTTTDGRWTEPQEVLSFRVRAHWYGQAWFIILVCIWALAMFYLINESLKKLRDNRFKRTEEKSRMNFLVNVSHELRTPLTLIIGPVERLLKHDNIQDDVMKSLKGVHKQAEIMQSLVDTILTAGRINSGALGAGTFSEKLNLLVKESVETFADEAQARGSKLKFYPDKSIGEIDTDPEILKIILSNIIFNAIRYNNPDQPIEVRTKANVEGNLVRVIIKDYGKGITQEGNENIFDDAFRKTEEKTRITLGMAYARSLVERLGGTIGASNNQGEPGTTFWFDLPAKQGTFVSGERRIVNMKMSEANVLFVDDDSDLRHYIQDELADICGSVTLAANGKEALDILKTNEVDIVISDVMMPEIDGITLCRSIKDDPKLNHIPVILLTARADAASRQKGIEARSDFYMPKPFDIAQLLSTMERLLQEN